MQATANPLRRPKPARDQCFLHGRFYFTDQDGRLESSLGAHVCLTAEHLWVTPELSIPIGQIDSIQLVSRRGLPPRRFLQIRFENPITGAPEILSLCKPDPVGIGLYRVRPLQELMRRIEELPARRESPEVGVARGLAREEPPELDRCEVCGAKPAGYVGYVYLVSAVLIAYRSEAKRRIHCRKHNTLHGLGYYALTVLTGWIGLGVLAYPFVVFAAARNLSPSIGKTSYVLGVLPPVALAILLVRWLL